MGTAGRPSTGLRAPHYAHLLFGEGPLLRMGVVQKPSSLVRSRKTTSGNQKGHADSGVAPPICTPTIIMAMLMMMTIIMMVMVM
eukprot:5407778-Pyramimonas_sp.AAC.1